MSLGSLRSAPREDMERFAGPGWQLLPGGGRTAAVADAGLGVGLALPPGPTPRDEPPHGATGALQDKVAGGRRGAEPPARGRGGAQPHAGARTAAEPPAKIQSPGTSLDSQVTSGTRAPDREGDEEYRNAVADALQALWATRAAAMRSCGAAGIRMRCRTCGRVSVFPQRCNARTCPTCAGRGARLVLERVAKRVAIFELTMEGQGWEGPGAPQRRGFKLLTLTVRSRPERAERFDPRLLRARVRTMRGLFRQFWRRTAWGRQVRDPITSCKRSRRDTGYVLALEVGPGGNIHFHVLVHGEYAPQQALQGLWSRVVGDLAIVHVEAVRGPGLMRGALGYVVKYVLKGANGGRARPQHAAAVEYALRGVRRVEIGGALRSVSATGSTAPEGEDVRVADMERPTGACEGCGAVGQWSWDGRLAPSEVALGGGFGLLDVQEADAPYEPDPEEEERRAQREGA